MTRCTAGFTLLELLLALALTAVVATAALASVNGFVEADQRSSTRLEDTASIACAMQLLRRDVGDAASLTFSTIPSGQSWWMVTRLDGITVAYAVSKNGVDLYRWQGTDPGTLAALAHTAANKHAPTMQVRTGKHMADIDYLPAAVVRGAASIVATPVSLETSTLGLSLVVVGTNGTSTPCFATSLALLEAYRLTAIAATK